MTISRSATGVFELYRSTTTVLTLEPNTVIDGRYRILEPLGSGSMGVVFRGEDIWLGRSVAIKVVDPANSSDAEAAKHFVREARSLAQIRHENIVHVYAFGTHEGLYYFAMEYVPGETLDAIIEEHAARGTTVDFDRALSIVRSIARGLAAVHCRGLVHRDVKPGNIVIEKDSGRPVLVDFGLARRHRVSSPRVTSTAGTPSYMPPEQARDVDGTQVSAASDLYAFACSVFELFTGRPLFDGKDIYEVLRAHLEDRPPTISTFCPELLSLDPIFARALAKSAQFRHETVAEFLAEIEAAMAPSRTSIPPGSAAKLRRARADGPRVLLLQGDDGLARQLTRAADRALDRPAIEYFSAASDLVEAFERSPASLVILDEDSSASPIAPIVFALRKLAGGTEVAIIVLSRNWDAGPSGLENLGVRELPKPVNLHIVESVLRKAFLSLTPRVA